MPDTVVVSAPAASSPPPPPSTPGSRLMSIDALRGFDMFWIVGADAFVEALRKLSDNPIVRGLETQLSHVGWRGFHFEDLIFPLFVFIVGISLVYSLTRLVEREGRAAAVRRVIRRGVLLYLIGIFYYGGFGTPFERIRLLGVLQRIALAYLFAGLAFCYLKPRGLVALCAGLLLGYWAMMTFIPVPGVGAGNFDEGKNLANWIDAQYLPLRKWDGDHDPEGLLSTLPAIANCLLGVFAGLLLRRTDRSEQQKVLSLFKAGLVLVAAGWLWNLQFPVIKKIWTSSFVLVACGYGCLLMALFHQIVEVWDCRAWAQPFVWIGMNPITIYLVHELVDLPALARRFVGGDLGRILFGRGADLAAAVVVMLLTFWICRWLYRRKIFLRF